MSRDERHLALGGSQPGRPVTTRDERLAALRESRTVEDAAPIVRKIVAAEMPDALPFINRAIADAQTASAPEDGLHRLGMALVGIQEDAEREDVYAALHTAGCALGASVGLHGDCAASRPCEVERPTSCPHEHGRALSRAAQEAEWSAIELRDDADGACHYLDGRAIHAGDTLELQAREERTDPEHARYWRPLAHGVPAIYVSHGAETEVQLLVTIAGHIFSKPLADGMRFRWPQRGHLLRQVKSND